VLWARLSRIPDRWVDAGLVLILLAIHLAWAAQHHPAATVPLSLATVLSLLVRRRRPLPVLGIVLAGAVTTQVAYDWSEPVIVWFALFTVALRVPRRTSLAAGLVRPRAG
jgi:hypothetical protein